MLYFQLEISASSITNVATPYYTISAQQLTVHWSLREVKNKRKFKKY